MKVTTIGSEKKVEIILNDKKYKTTIPSGLVEYYEKLKEET